MLCMQKWQIMNLFIGCRVFYGVDSRGQRPRRGRGPTVPPQGNSGRHTIYAIKNTAPYKQVHDLPLLHTQHSYPYTI